MIEPLDRAGDEGRISELAHSEQDEIEAKAKTTKQQKEGVVINARSSTRQPIGIGIVRHGPLRQHLFIVIENNEPPVRRQQDLAAGSTEAG
jgi:hypothetical protein